jgi:hypothetical protein
MIRLATIDDLNKIMDIYNYARLFMAETGNPNQWINNYPSRELIISDIEKQELFICYDNEKIYGVFVFFMHIDETYNYIEGNWLNNEEYGVIHRIASAGCKKGVFSEAYEFIKNYVSNIRIDTHVDNIVMQNVLKKHGSVKCGTIYLKNGSPRLAYHFVNVEE